jgi:tellurite resistance protein
MSRGKVEALKAVLSLAYADGTLSEDESRLVEFLIDSHGLTPEEEQEVRSQQDADLNLEALSDVVTDPQDRARAYETAALVAMMDGETQAAESEMLQKLRPALSIDVLEAQRIEDKARLIYERFTAHQSGDGEDDA